MFSVGSGIFVQLQDLLRGIYNRIVRAFNSSDATRAVSLDRFKAFKRIWNASLLHMLFILRSYISLFRHISVQDDFKGFWMGDP